ncbi:hypothetical protein GJ496_005569 [Pomphorhynchus laevis]|nr:hypothetical protein GJ496_005569 [Pomphorhynchus laevis]
MLAYISFLYLQIECKGNEQLWLDPNIYNYDSGIFSKLEVFGYLEVGAYDALKTLLSRIEAELIVIQSCIAFENSGEMIKFAPSLTRLYNKLYGLPSVYIDSIFPINSRVLTYFVHFNYSTSAWNIFMILSKQVGTFSVRFQYDNLQCDVILCPEPANQYYTTKKMAISNFQLLNNENVTTIKYQGLNEICYKIVSYTITNSPYVIMSSFCDDWILLMDLHGSHIRIPLNGKKYIITKCLFDGSMMWLIAKSFNGFARLLTLNLTDAYLWIHPTAKNMSKLDSIKMTIY